MKIRKDVVVKYFQEHPGVTVEFRELMRLFGVTKADRTRFKAVMESLAEEGMVRKLKGNTFEAVKGRNTLMGKLSTHRDGYGFVTPEGGGEDIFIPARHLRGNMHGDRVEVTVIVNERSGKKEGQILRTVERAYSKIVGRFEKRGSFAYVIPDDIRITAALRILPGFSGKADEGQMVVAEITSYPTSHRQAEGKITEVLGWPDDPAVETLTIIRKYDLPLEFPPTALAAARALSPSVMEPDYKGRVDLRGLLTVTIDGETARDFDDAVSIQRESNGYYRLRVSIADVSHYVKLGSAIDAEAYLRGTSVYFPERCIPMLPEELSNGICSLNPDVDRLAVTVDILFDASADAVQKSFYPSVIKSSARLTYTTVKQILVDKDPTLSQSLAHLVADLTTMEDLAVRLMEKRRKRGSIDFDLPEPQVVLDLQGRTEAIIKAERTMAHRIIEEFMLAANEVVAGFIENRNVPSLYRIHETPDLAKLSEFSEFIHNFGYVFQIVGESVEPTQFQKLLEEAAGKPEERMINEMLLRSMKQARYSAENLGHFGLAAPCYTHFTSPIRRYPDLVVHRILKAILADELREKDLERLAATLPDSALHSSSRERLAMEAEREIILLKKLQFMHDKVGEEFDAVITGVTQHGFFVELVELFVEGMVHVATLPSDFYRFIEKQHALFGEHGKKLFRMGDGIRVRVAQVSIERKQIDFILAEGGRVQSSDTQGIPEVYPKIPVRGKRPKSASHKGGHRKGPGKRGKGR